VMYNKMHLFGLNTAAGFFCGIRMVW